MLGTLFNAVLQTPLGQLRDDSTTPFQLITTIGLLPDELRAQLAVTDRDLYAVVVSTRDLEIGKLNSAIFECPPNIPAILEECITLLGNDNVHSSHRSNPEPTHTPKILFLIFLGYTSHCGLGEIFTISVPSASAAGRRINSALQLPAPTPP